MNLKTIKPNKKQALLLACDCDEIAYMGGRGSGKSTALILDWILHEQRWGQNASGLLLRKTFPELEDLLQECRKIMPKFGHQYKTSEKIWEAKSGAQLKMGYLEHEKDADRYQGRNLNWLAYDEAGLWGNYQMLDKIKGSVRSANGVKPRVIYTGNPGGPGHNWLKSRFVDPCPAFKINKIQSEVDPAQYITRVYIHATVDDNTELMNNDPGYISRLKNTGPEYLWEAWRFGNWDIVAGGAFDDLWRREVHVLPDFTVPPSWFVYRSFDWGSSRPFSVGWWAKSDGTPVTIQGGQRTFPPGTLIRIDEWYGWSGKPNEGLQMTDYEIGQGIRQREAAILARHPGATINPGPADSAIFDKMPGKDSVAKGISSGYGGTCFVNAGKSGRVYRVEVFRRMLKSSIDNEGAGVYTSQRCTQFIRTVPGLPRDERNQDDVDTNAEDHIWDETGYSITFERPISKTVQVSWG